MSWIVVRSHPNRENFATEHCVRQGYQVFLPRILEFAGHGSQRIAIAKPLFPTYLFVGIEARWRPLLSTFGVRSVIMHGDSPAFVRPGIMEELRKRQDKDGFITLPKRKRGDHIEIARGPFAGMPGFTSACLRAIACGSSWACWEVERLCWLPSAILRRSRHEGAANR